MFKSSKPASPRDVSWPSCGTSRGQNDGTSDVGQTCFLNSTHKHIKLNWTGYSSLYSGW